MKTFTYPIYDIPKDDVAYIYKQAYESTNSLLKINYSEKRIKLDESLAVSLTYHNDIPICVSTILERNIFNGTSRCLNRYFFDSSNNQKGLHIFDYDKWMRKSSAVMLDQQVEFSKKMGFDGHFISTSHHKLYRKRTIHGINHHSKYKWNLCDGYRLVVEGKDNNLSCWQTIIYSGRLGLKESRQTLQDLS